MHSVLNTGIQISKLAVVAGFLLTGTVAWAQGTTRVKGEEAYVDKNGIMRWRKSNEEVCAFGVNYTAMFAHAYRVAKSMNIPLEKAIDDDVYHFARLGFDAFRVHMWDCEISDTLGNVLNNDHLRLFDYTIMKMKERGMKFVITPIAYWGNGYPQPDEKTPGFATKFGKDNCLTNPQAIQAQETYLFQLLNHINTYTRIPYKDDPDVIGFEICNEPHHKEAPEKVTTFINRMVQSMRKTGCTKPIFYNISHSVHLADAYFNSLIQGGTFQWYPTGLGARHELGGNLLPNVEKYTTPFAGHPKYGKITKLVYEFDAADVGRSYIYPAMVRSFREAGIQFATHFAYDPTFMASSNTEYNTHYMNLAYAPQKALSLKIASEVFHKIPINKSFGAYPDNSLFDVFKVSYENDLAEMVTEKKFFYTNNTLSLPPSPDKLEQIAGFGNSSVVKYEGYGAYFLDRIEPGVWRLELMPDAIWVSDPFKRTSLSKEVAVIKWNEWPMAVNLPDLGTQFTIRGMNDGNQFAGQADGMVATVAPGAYLLLRNGITTQRKGEDRWNNIQLKEFVAPPREPVKTYLLHQPPEELTAGSSLEIDAMIVSPEAPAALEVIVLGTGFRPESIQMKRVKGYQYHCTIPEKLVREGFLRYYIVMKEGNSYHAFPSGVKGRPLDWDFFDENPYKVRVVGSNTPVFLFNAADDADQMARQWTRGSSLIPSGDPNKAQLLVNVEKLFFPDPENKDGKAFYDYSFRYFFGKKTMHRGRDFSSAKKIVFRGRALNDKPCKLQLALVMKNGSAYGGIVSVGTGLADYELALTDLKSVKPVTLPRPYPTFLPYFFEGKGNTAFDPDAIESIQFSIGPEIPPDEIQEKHGVAIESVRLE